MADDGGSSEDEASDRSQDANEQPIAVRCVATISCVGSKASAVEIQPH